jgi:hypothetical protein
VLLQILEKALQFGDLTTASVCIYRQQNRQDQNTQSERAQIVGEIAQALPGQGGKAHRQQHHEQQYPAPKLRLLVLKISRRPGCG